MILEEIDGSVTCTITRENAGQVQLSPGDYFSDHESATLIVVGNGKVIVRVDPNCTFEVPGVKAAEEEVPVPVPVPVPVAQEVVVVDTVTATEETPAIVFPTKTAE
jgi:hypothetical protein